MKTKRCTPIKIRRLKIANYKGIDELELEFPVPRMVDDHDIFVMGSRNGLGKTSILECCSLLLLAITLPEERFKLRDRYSTVDVPDLLINADANSAEIEGDVVVGEASISLSIRIDRHGIVKVSGDSLQELRIENDLFDPESETDDFVKAICGFSPNPVIESTFLFFHSYRKVQEGNPELAMMVDRGRSVRRGMYPRQELPMSAFKLRILRSLMGQANLFEFVDNQESDEVIMRLNELVSKYAGGTINKLRSSPDNTVDFRVKPKNGGDSFTFDGLSSGQKEIISTLFLIWYHTRNSPSVVFVDEPEMHLNAQWHRSFVKQLIRLAPQNQYILATHSEDIMDSVPEDRRLLLVSDKEVE
jgi:predicted ATP-dependent endonuclease of OLD family